MSLRRERLRCDACGWTGVTRQGRWRAGIFVAGVAAAVGLVAAAQLGLLVLGDQGWAWALTILLVSIAARMFVRGDRCRSCAAALELQRARG